MTFNVNGGNPLDNDTLDVFYDNNYVLPIPTRSGYSFQGWSTNSAADEIEYFDGESFYTPAHNTIFYAVWKPETYKITFNANNGAWNDNSTTQVVSGRYGKTVNISAPDRTGYHFSSWDNSVPLVFGVDNINFSANWIPNSDTIYKVEHWQQNINDDNYTQLTGDTQTLSGTTAENTAG